MNILYHGTNMFFEVPDVNAGREGMDLILSPPRRWRSVSRDLAEGAK